MRSPWPRTPIYLVFLRASSQWEAIALSYALLIIWVGMLPRFGPLALTGWCPGVGSEDQTQIRPARTPLVNTTQLTDPL